MHNANILILILSAGLWASCPATASPPPEPVPGLKPGDSRSTPPGGEQVRSEASAKYLFMRAHIDFIAKSKRFTPLIEASLASMPGARVEDEAGEFDLRHGKLDALVPVPLSRDSFLLMGVMAGIRRYDFDSDVTGGQNNTLYNFGLRIGAGRYLNDDLVIQGYWQPSINSDLDDGGLDGGDFKPWHGDTLLVYRTRDNLFWKAGLIFTDAFDTAVVPSGGFSWGFAPDWQLDMLLPRATEISFTPSAHWLFLGGLELEGLDVGRYRVSVDTATGNTAHDDVRVQELRAFLGARYRFDLNFSSFIRAGAAVGGNYDWDFGDGIEYDGNLETSPFVQAGLGWYF